MAPKTASVFKLDGPPPLRKTPNAGVRLVDPSVGEVFRHSREDGESLPQAAREVGVPDYAVGSPVPSEAGNANGEDHPQLPSYDSPDMPAARKGRPPFKLS